MATMRPEVEQAINGHAPPQQMNGAMQSMAAQDRQFMQMMQHENMQMMRMFQMGIGTIEKMMPTVEQDYEYLRETFGPNNDSLEITHRYIVRAREVK